MEHILSSIFQANNQVDFLNTSGFLGFVSISRISHWYIPKMKSNLSQNLVLQIP